MKGRIDLKGIEVLAKHGVLADEQENEQLFIVDISIVSDFAPAAESDALEETVDYGVLAQMVHDLVASESHQLIEKLVDRVASVVLEDQRVQTATVTIHKPQAPIEVSFSDVSVTLTKSR